MKPIYRALSMKDAVEKGYKLAETGDIVRVSPACSSLIGTAVLKSVEMTLNVVFICCKRTPLMKRVIISVVALVDIYPAITI